MSRKTVLVIKCLLLIYLPDCVPDSSITKYLPVEVAAPDGKDTAKLQLMVPTRGEHQISNPAELFQHVKTSWDAVVEENQAVQLIKPSTVVCQVIRHPLGASIACSPSSTHLPSTSACS